MNAVPMATEVLRHGQQRYPADFWINFTLAYILSNKTEPPHLEEAVAYYRAALALRPTAPAST